MGAYELGSQLYRGPLKAAADRLGARSLYKRLLLSSIDVYTVELETSTTKFHVKSESELFHLKNNTASELETLEDLVSNLCDGDVFYDVGANIGVYSCIASVATNVIETIAFEPYPPNVSRIRDNAELNDLEVTVEDIALSDKDGEASFAVDERQSSGSGRGKLGDSEANGMTVQTRRGDSYVDEGAPHPTVLKIDVEGALN